MTPVDVFGDALPEGWPAPLDVEAYHGITGEIVRLCMPHTEVDPAAILVQFLVAAGSMIGRGPHWVAGADEHHAQLHCCLVGDTADGRKGQALGMTLAFLRRVDPDWARRRIKSGITSGEGIIAQVRDRDDEEPVDKRLLLREPEFGGVLRKGKRDGSSVSSVLREAWDGEPLGNLTKTEGHEAREYHIGLIGNVTSLELRRELTTTDTGNGFANRMLWVASRRSKLLPSGGDFGEVDIEPIVLKLRWLVGQARQVRRIGRDADAEALWPQMYSVLVRRRSGVFGAVTARAEAQVMRLALIYALLDGEPSIRVQHVYAGLAVWAYAEETCWFLWGESTGDRDADRILRGLRSGELSRSQIRELFGSNNVPATRVDRALAVLLDAGLARNSVVPTAGRPAEVWEATGARIQAIRELLPSHNPQISQHPMLVSA